MESQIAASERSPSNALDGIARDHLTRLGNEASSERPGVTKRVAKNVTKDANQQVIEKKNFLVGASQSRLVCHRSTFERASS